MTTEERGQDMNQHRFRSSRRRWQPAVLVVSSLLAPGLCMAQPAGPFPSRISLSINDHRPLSALARELEKRYQLVLTYEEGPWVAGEDLADVTREVARSDGPGRVAPTVPVIVPRKAAVRFEYALDSAKGRPADYTDLLSALLLQYDAAGAPGQFRFEGANGIYHLIPSRLKDAAGRWQPVKPVLSTPVRLADEERTVEEALQEIVAQLNEASLSKVGWGLAPLNLFHQTRIRLSADGVPAREVMRQILELLPYRATWRLNYDPTTKRYYLNFLLLPGGR
jgi:hypothetical protein